MAWKIWKSKEDRIREEFEGAINARNQTNWSKAIEKLMTVYQLSQEVSDPGLKQLGKKAAGMALIYRIKLDPKTPANYEEAIKFLSSLDPELILELPYKVKVGDIIPELKILKEFLIVLQKHNPNELKNLAQECLSLGKEKLILSDILGININPEKTAYKLFGMSKYMIAQDKEEEDPQESVSIYSEAQGFFIRAEDNEYITRVNEKINKLSKVKKCYICNRSLQGEEIHFLYVNADITTYILKMVKSESPEAAKDEETIVMCKGCYSAVNNLAEVIAHRYYEMAMQVIQKVREELDLRIEMIEREISRIKSVISRIESEVRNIKGSIR